MKIGVPKEIKIEESRVGLVPAAVQELVTRGHEVLVQQNAGFAIGFSDDHYRKAGAEIVATAEEVFAGAQMIVKVKEIQTQEYKFLKPDHILFTYLHLAPDLEQTQALIESGCAAIAYETVTNEYGRLPLLAPMSEIAGRLSVQAGGHCLEKPQGGQGILLGGVPGVAPGKVVILGGGVVGTNALRMAIGRDAQVVVMDRSLKRLRELDAQYGGRLITIYSSLPNIEEQIQDANLVIGAVLLPGGAAPRLISREQLSLMKPGSVIVDVAIDQGGCIETSKATSHTDPTYVVDGVLHYCVSNMPGAVPRTSTIALNNATLAFVLQLADCGLKAALEADPHFMLGLNVYDGKVTHAKVAESLGLTYTDPNGILH